jgi:hypothetical protein
MEHLERHRPIVAEVMGTVDRRHPAAAELALDAITVRERGLEVGGSIRQMA